MGAEPLKFMSRFVHCCPVDEKQNDDRIIPNLLSTFYSKREGKRNAQENDAGVPIFVFVDDEHYGG